MKDQNFFVSATEKNICIDGRSGILTVTRVDEIMPDGSKEAVHIDIHFRAKEIPSYMGRLFECISPKNVKLSERRVA